MERMQHDDVKLTTSAHHQILTSTLGRCKTSTMHQTKYALELISEAELAGAKLVITPVDTNTKFTSRQYDELMKYKYSPKENPLADQGVFQRLIVKLLYLTVTRPDISFSVQALSQ